MTKDLDWYGLYRMSLNPEDSLIAYAKGTEDQMIGVNVWVFYGDLLIKKESPSKLEYKSTFKNRIIVHSKSKEDAIKISKKIILEEKNKKW